MFGWVDNSDFDADRTAEAKMRCAKRRRRDAGGCSFCMSAHTAVWEVVSGRGMAVRFCESCRDEFVRQTKG